MKAVYCLYRRTVFARPYATHTIERKAFKFEYTVFAISKHICANIKFHKGGRPMIAPTG